MDPYRSPASSLASCRSCAAALPDFARACSSCGEDAARVRCTECFSLVFATAPACSHCGAQLELEAELEATSSLCPRCSHGLFFLTANEFRIEECKACGGQFVDHDSLAHILLKHRPRSDHAPLSQSSPKPEDEVIYLPCPRCSTRMNRAIFGRKSGVIVDVCKIHGTWFDALELTNVLAFVEHGGLENAERQRLLEKRELEKQLRLERRTAAMYESLNGPVRSPLDRAFDPAPTREEGLLDLLDILLRG